MQIDIKGDVVDSETGQMFKWFGMQNTNPQAIQEQLEQAGGKDVQLNISSPGGDVTAAAEIYTMLSQYPGKVTGVVQGIAASAASVIAEACDHLSISPAATMMIHRSATRNEGNTNDFSQTATTLSKIDQTICSVYQAKTGKSRDEILDLMDKETWLTPKDAVDQGFADEILTINDKAPQMANSIGSMPVKDKVDEFMKFLVDQKSENKDESTIDSSKNEEYFDSALFKSKLKILKGENDERNSSN